MWTKPTSYMKNSQKSNNLRYSSHSNDLGKVHELLFICFDTLLFTILVFYSILIGIIHLIVDSEGKFIKHHLLLHLYFMKVSITMPRKFFCFYEKIVTLLIIYETKTLHHNFLLKYY